MFWFKKSPKFTEGDLHERVKFAFWPVPLVYNNKFGMIWLERYRVLETYTLKRRFSLCHPVALKMAWVEIVANRKRYKD